MDNFFSSTSLGQDLYRRGFLAVGTLRTNRTLFPKTMLTVNSLLSEGQDLYRQWGNVVCVSWLDQKPVHFLSTYCINTFSLIEKCRPSARTCEMKMRAGEAAPRCHLTGRHTQSSCWECTRCWLLTGLSSSVG